ncbi:MAG: SoxR reducing system RseC family protein [Clostridia bacterium]
MISKGIVQKIIDDKHAEVCVTRQSACGENCASCSGCAKPTYKAVTIARNPINAQVGDVVNLKSEDAIILKGAVYVYVLPLVLFFVFYAFACYLTDIESTRNVFAIAGFSFGVSLAIFYSKKMSKNNNVTVEIFK